MALYAPTPDEVEKVLSLSAGVCSQRSSENTFADYYPKKRQLTAARYVTYTVLLFDEAGDVQAYAVVNENGGGDIRVGEWTVTIISTEAPMAAHLSNWQIGDVGCFWGDDSELLLTNINGGVVPDAEQRAHMREAGRQRQREQEERERREREERRRVTEARWKVEAEEQARISQERKALREQAGQREREKAAARAQQDADRRTRLQEEDAKRKETEKLRLETAEKAEVDRIRSRSSTTITLEEAWRERQRLSSMILPNKKDMTEYHNRVLAAEIDTLLARCEQMRDSASTNTACKTTEYALTGAAVGLLFGPLGSLIAAGIGVQLARATKEPSRRDLWDVLISTLHSFRESHYPESEA